MARAQACPPHGAAAQDIPQTASIGAGSQDGGVTTKSHGVPAKKAPAVSAGAKFELIPYCGSL
jgi:hypothetical protein